jgi:L-ascorbate metabolism protein UlaG (beta-lactamase superfamily)
MKIKWLGNACFMITSEAGLRIITDPYLTGYNLKYGQVNESAEVVTVSHEHLDHNYVAAVRGNPEVVRGIGTFKVRGIEFRGVHSFHDEVRGSRRGSNTMFRFEVDGISICHLGDLGHRLSDKQVSELGSIDILLVPTCGYYTMSVKTATEVCNQLKPKVIIPMHFKTDGWDAPVADVDEFLEEKESVTKLNASEVKFEQEDLPATTQIIVLKPEL